MEAVSPSNGKGSRHLPASPIHHHQCGSALGGPLQGIKHRPAALQKSLQVKQIRTQIEDCMAFADGKIMNRTRIVQRHGLAISQAVAVEAIEVKPRDLRRKKDPEVEHLACVRIELRMGGEWTGLVETSIESSLAQGL